MNKLFKRIPFSKEDQHAQMPESIIIARKEISGILLVIFTPFSLCLKEARRKPDGLKLGKVLRLKILGMQ